MSKHLSSKKIIVVVLAIVAYKRMQVIFDILSSLLMHEERLAAHQNTSYAYNKLRDS